LLSDRQSPESDLKALDKRLSANYLTFVGMISGCLRGLQ